MVILFSQKLICLPTKYEVPFLMAFIAVLNVDVDVYIFLSLF